MFLGGYGQMYLFLWKNRNVIKRKRLETSECVVMGAEWSREKGFFHHFFSVPHSIPSPPRTDLGWWKTGSMSDREWGPTDAVHPQAGGPPRTSVLGRILLKALWARTGVKSPKASVWRRAARKKRNFCGAAVAMSGASCEKNGLGPTRSVTPFGMGRCGTWLLSARFHKTSIGSFQQSLPRARRLNRFYVTGHNSGFLEHCSEGLWGHIQIQR